MLIDWLGMTTDGGIKYNKENIRLENAMLSFGGNYARIKKTNDMSHEEFTNKLEEDTREKRKKFSEMIESLNDECISKQLKLWSDNKDFDLNFRKMLTKVINILSNGGELERVENNEESTSKRIEKLVDNGCYQIILTGAPGTGKTHDMRSYAEDKGKKLNYNQGQKSYKFIQFHSSYDYTDFMEGLRPVDDGNDGIKFVKLDGVFKKFCREVVEENNKVTEEDGLKNKYFFLIDEVNRADLGKVFGELMFGLEEGYRGEENRFDTQYQNMPTYKIENGKSVLEENDCFATGFYIPENVVIIGTMNDIDRSVEAFDFALRRRFQWVEVKANQVMKSKLEKMRSLDSDIDKKEMIDAAMRLNSTINEKGKKFGLGEAYHIGPAYFKSGDKESIWRYKVEPILREYCRSFDAEDFIVSCEAAFKGTEPK
ncbi:AAA family ATPase [Clostridium algidicarnis]|uniref:AAA family ATPase n=1 Tax=Clostridium algidicarnis TaxID=37659 RepID=UPI003FD8116D